MIEEEDVVALRSIVLDYSDVFDALCCNIRRQLNGGSERCMVEEVEHQVERNEAIDPREEDINNVFACSSSNNGVIDQKDRLALDERSYRIEFEANTLGTFFLPRHDKCSLSVSISDQTLNVWNIQRDRTLHCRYTRGGGDRDDDVDRIIWV